MSAQAITIPWGNIAAQAAVVLLPVALAAAGAAYAWVKSKLPKALVTGLDAAHADTLLNRAVNQAIAMVEGAVKGKTVSVSIANALIATAAENLAQDAPALIQEWGSRAAKIIAGKLVDLNMLGADANAQTLAIPGPVAKVQP